MATQAPIPNNVDSSIALTSAIGAMVIESLTILGSLYLLFPLSKQGMTKLRVRLLFGMVLSDFLLGVTGAIPNAAYLAGHPLRNGTKACNATGFILTSVLFTQHMWTAAIAITTYALLKYPLSQFTYYIDQYWHWIPVMIWGSAFLQAGLWWRFIGFSTTGSGSLCYYADGPNHYDKDLIQFIPRALVFIIVITLYSQLYRFLRRPDTIEISSHDVSEIEGSGNPHVGQSSGNKIINKAKTKIVGLTASKGDVNNEWPLKPLGGEVPPWEKLHLNYVGGVTDLDPLDAGDGGDMMGFAEQGRKNTGSSLATVIPLQHQYSSTELTPEGEKSGYLDTEEGLSPRHIDFGLEFIPEGKQVNSRNNPVAMIPGVTHTRESSTTELMARRGSAPLCISRASSRRVSIDRNAILADEQRNGKGRNGSSATETDEESEDDSDITPKRAREQTLAEFFAENQAPIDELEARARLAGRRKSQSTAGMPQSAASYFNRQASLLMLYFPIAYLIVFTFSLVRLMYDMIKQEANPILGILSLWFVLSVGLVDALIYGLAEYMVRRRVRKRIPDRFSSPSR